VILEKLIIHQLVQKFPALYRSRNLILYPENSANFLFPIQIHPPHNPTLCLKHLLEYYPPIYPYVIQALSSGFPTKQFFFILVRHMPSLSHISCLNLRNYVW
jgi:hypothetical protein